MRIQNITKIMAEIKELDNELRSIRVTGEAGGGMVKATVNGKQELIKLEIDPSLIAEKDRELLEDLVMGAVNNALRRVFEEVAEKIRSRAFRFDMQDATDYETEKEG